ncbi:hypothetical protein Rhopal_005304-T1 [Rhodotorula paludigena]|uniref:Uncharacterized protein n=1 Tax=Rhodotorula paludigena TaxID=86838 RepID=A0AAV5GP71_9BASI|nr:hypothetical protein Rhopal_005304-T1 [Rhodotorula paludigena]
MASETLADPHDTASLDRFDRERDASDARCDEWSTYREVPKDPISNGQARRVRYEQVSYYLGSRGKGLEGGVNDMYDVPLNSAETRAKAASLLELVTGQDPQTIRSKYLNGARLLSDSHLAYLIISTPEPSFTPAEADLAVDPEREQEYDLFLLSTHFIGDGMALHTTANDFFTLLAGGPGDEALPCQHIEAVLAARGDKPTSPGTETTGDAAVEAAQTLAPAMESKLVVPAAWGNMGWSAAKVEFANEQAKLVGGHAFPRARLGPRHTLVPTVSYPLAETRRILAACKLHGVTIAHAMFALSSLAFVRTVEERRKNPELPVMLYSALNVRGHLKREDSPVDPYHIAIGYYNIILPSFLPRDLPASAYFWHQARSVKQQTTRATKSPLLAARTLLMALERERRSIGFERADDERREREAIEAMVGLGISGVAAEQEKRAGANDAAQPKEEEAHVKPAGDAQTQQQKQEHLDRSARPKAPSTALMGLSMLGNLDAIYRHEQYHGIKLDTLTTGSRQRPGALLLFAYTFAGQLWISLGHDSNGFKHGVIERWWAALLAGVEQFLVLDEA